MSKIRLKKGYNIRIEGEAKEEFLKTSDISCAAIDASEFVGAKFKLNVRENDKVKAGDALLYNKDFPEMKLTSPVSGVVQEIRRGARRVLQEIVVAKEGEDFKKFASISADALLNASREEILQTMLDAGVFASIIQRPFAIVAEPNKVPKNIFISAYHTAPLSPNVNFLLKDNEAFFQAGINALSRLTDNKVHLNVEDDKEDLSDALLKVNNAELNFFKGPHPAGNVGVQIHHLDPINKGDVVWTLNVQSVIDIGYLFLQGHINNKKIIAIAGTDAQETGYLTVNRGSKMSEILPGVDDAKTRIINGDVLSGNTSSSNGFVGYYNNLITLIPEINKKEFMGWLKPNLQNESFSRTFFSWLSPKKKYVHNTGYHGGIRALVATGVYEKVLPMDIYPVHLVKSIMYEDFEEMEALGIYEVAPEDFALCDYVCVSKTETQYLIRHGLNKLHKEG